MNHYRHGECTIVSVSTVSGRRLVGFRVSANLYEMSYPAGTYILHNLCIIQARKGSRVRKEYYNGRAFDVVKVKDIVYDDEHYEID